jgi:metal-responsive CopG/Arc/MetJ family transcriptional regulator
MTQVKQKVIKFPLEVIGELERLVQPGKRSEFVVEATRERLERVKLGQALAKTAGSLKSEDYPEFAASEDVAKWVRELRERDFSCDRGE